MSLRTRLALLSAIVVAAAVVVATTISYVVINKQLREEVDESLRGAVVRVADIPAPELALPYFSSPAIGPRYYIQVTDAEGRTQRPEGQTLKMPVTARDRETARGGHGIWLYDATVDGQHLRVATAPAQGGKAVQFARSVEDVDATIDDLRITLLIVTLAGILAAALLGLLIGAAILRPVAKLTKAAEHVAETQDLGASIEVRRHDELGRLASSLNAMLTALDASRRQQRQLVSDASHELRTPLTSLRTNIEVLAREADIAETERQQLLADVATQLEELTMLMDDLVELARDDGAPLTGDTEELDLAELLSSAVERARLRAPDVTINVDARDSGRVEGTAATLERAFVNVLDNACKWSPSGERVDVTLDGGTITVRDRGAGIDALDLPRVFDRFYRATTARALPGSGLGLAIVRRVIEDHRGTVVLEEAAGGGTIARISLPTIARDLVTAASTTRE